MGPRLQEHRDGLPAAAPSIDLVDDRSLVVDIDADDLGTELVEQIEQRRERGVFDDHSIAEADDDLGDAVEGVHRPVDHGQRLGRERPAVAQPGLEFGQHRVVEVARRQRLAADLGDGRTEIGKQRRRGRAGRQIERKVAGAFGDSAVPPGRARARRLAHERALPAAGVDRADRGERLPRLADGGRRDAERLRQLAHGRQARADRQVAARDHPPHRGGDSAGAAILDGIGERGGHCAVTIARLCGGLGARSCKRRRADAEAGIVDTPGRTGDLSHATR